MDDEWLNGKSSSTGEQVITANKDKLSALSTGDIDLQIINENEDVSTIKVKDVLHVPGISANLLSVSKIAKKGYSLIFNSQECKIVTGKININGEIIAQAVEENDMYRLRQPVQRIHYIGSKDKAEIWHKSLGHMNRKSMSMLTHGYVTGIDYERPSSNVCVSCVKGKQHKQFFRPSTNQSKELLQVVHSDLCGPMETKSNGGSRYFLSFIDDCSRKVFIYFLQTKDQLPNTFEEFKALAEKQSNRQIKILRSDNGREYINQRLLKYLKNNGIKHQTTIPYTPEQNGLAERMNRTIVEKARCLLQEAGLGKEFWAEAVATAVYLINRSPAKGLNGITPEEAWSKRKPDLAHLRIFGCKAMAHIPKQLRKKWDSKSREYIFIGYCEDSKGYRLWDPEHKSIVKARDVIFLENTKAIVTSVPTEKEDSSQREFIPLTDSEVNAHIEDLGNEEEDAEENQEIVRASSDESDTDDSDYVDSLETLQEVETLRRSNRVPKPKNFSDYVLYKAAVISDDPETVKEAIRRPDRKLWMEAMQSEYDSLLENKTWDLVDLPPDKKALTSRWIFKTKRNANSEIKRHKARLVIRGCSQKKGIDYEETYSPVVRYGTIRVLFALAAKYDLDVDHIDAVTAFLHGDLTEEIYMRQPEGFVIKGKEAKVCRLRKAMYGLKQGSRAWNQRLNSIIQQIGFTQSKVDQCVYIYTKEDKKIIIVVYVDDLLIFSNNKNLKEITKSKLMEQFKMKDLGEVKQCLGLRITRDRDAGKIWIDQSAYIEDIINRFNMQNCNEASTPLDINQKLSKEMSPTTEEEKTEMAKVPYQELVGRVSGTGLIFACQGTRPDIAHAIGIISRFNNNPGRVHWSAAKRILRYLKATSNLKLEFSKDGNHQLQGYCDADWAGDLDDRHSITGHVFGMSGAAVTWNSKKQATVALSTTEAEYMAMSAASQEAMWLKNLLHEIDKDSNRGGTMIYCDNKGAMELGLNGGY